MFTIKFLIFFIIILYIYNIIMSISFTGLYGSATIVNSDLFNDVIYIRMIHTYVHTYINIYI
jgi:hypothetical protein